MDRIPFIDNPEVLQEEFEELLETRRSLKESSTRTERVSLTTAARQRILDKTDSRCHICGCDLDMSSFEADHVKNHMSGGSNAEENFLPCCKTCNNYRWHYSAEELQWILKIGVWARKEILDRSKTGNEMATEFTKKEAARERRRRVPRVPKGQQDGAG